MARRPLFTSAELPVVAAPTGLVPLCGACGMYKGCKTPKMVPGGEGRRRILVVAEAPEQTEDEQGTQLVGEFGQMLRKALAKHGVDMRRDCWLTNALICRPPGNEIPDDKMVDYCRPNLLNTIEKLKPEVIILVGAVAVDSLITHLRRGDGAGSITQWAGWQIPCQSLNAWVCPTYHPAYLMRANDPVLEVLQSKHLGAAVALAGSPPWPAGPPDYAGKVRVCMNPDAAVPFLRRLLDSCKPFAFDYETNMLKPDSEQARVACCSVYDGKECVAYPWRGAAVELTGQLLAGPAKKIGFNLKFEDRWTFKQFGHGVNNWAADAMLDAHVLDCRTGAHGLDFQAFVRLGVEKYDTVVGPYLKSGRAGGNAPNRVFEADPHSLLLYCGTDSVVEWEVAKHQRKEFQRS
jgi:uracil-DNA glycosylase family 4